MAYFGRDDVAYVVLRYLDEEKFPRTFETFREEAASLVNVAASRRRRAIPTLGSVLNEYVGLKLERDRRQRFADDLSGGDDRLRLLWDELYSELRRVLADGEEHHTEKRMGVEEQQEAMQGVQEFLLHNAEMQNMLAECATQQLEGENELGVPESVVNDVMKRTLEEEIEEEEGRRKRMRDEQTLEGMSVEDILKKVRRGK